MSQNVETQYDDLLNQLNSKLGKIDLKLATQVLYYERNLPDVAPRVELDIHYRDGTNLDKKKYELDTSGYMVATEGKNTIKAVGLASMNDLFALAKDPEIKKISGSANCASY